MLQNLVLHNKIGDPDAGSTVEHFEKSVGSLEDVWRHPFGQGPGTAGPASFYSHTPNVPENYYLQIAEEVGIIGLILFAAINVVVVLRLWPRRQEFWAKILLASFVGILVVNMFLHGWADETLAMTWWAIAGLFMFLPANTVARPKNRAPRPRPS
jgi:O-antigen ligase